MSDLGKRTLPAHLTDLHLNLYECCDDLQVHPCSDLPKTFKVVHCTNDVLAVQVNGHPTDEDFQVLAKHLSVSIKRIDVSNPNDLSGQLSDKGLLAVARTLPAHLTDLRLDLAWQRVAWQQVATSGLSGAANGSPTALGPRGVTSVCASTPRRSPSACAGGLPGRACAAGFCLRLLEADGCAHSLSFFF